MMLISSACTHSSSPPKAESEYLFIPLEGGDWTCAFLQRRRLTSQSMLRKDWLNVSHSAKFNVTPFVRWIPTIFPCSFGVMTEVNQYLTIILLDNYAEGVFSIAFPWSPHNSDAIDTCLLLNVRSLLAHWRLPHIFLVLPCLIKVLHVDQSAEWWPIREQYHWYYGPILVVGNPRWLIRDWLHNPLVIYCHTPTSSTSTTQMVLPTRHYKLRWFPTLCVHTFHGT